MKLAFGSVCLSLLLVSNALADSTIVASSWLAKSLLSGDKAHYTIVDVLQFLNKNGQVSVDLEQEDFLPEFDYFNLDGSTDSKEALQKLLGSQGYAYEMHDAAMVIYEKKLRDMGDQYPLNRKIASLKLANVSIEQCLQEVGKQFNVTIHGGGSRDSDYKKPALTFNIEVSNITLREALFKIASQAQYKTWHASWRTAGDKKFLIIAFE